MNSQFRRPLNFPHQKIEAQEVKPRVGHGRYVLLYHLDMEHIMHIAFWTYSVIYSVIFFSSTASHFKVNLSAGFAAMGRADRGLAMLPSEGSNDINRSLTGVYGILVTAQYTIIHRSFTGLMGYTGFMFFRSSKLTPRGWHQMENAPQRTRWWPVAEPDGRDL